VPRLGEPLLRAYGLSLSKKEGASATETKVAGARIDGMQASASGDKERGGCEPFAMQRNSKATWRMYELAHMGFAGRARAVWTLFYVSGLGSAWAERRLEEARRGSVLRVFASRPRPTDPSLAQHSTSTPNIPPLNPPANTA
jgi:hypothetical protein